MAVPGCRAVRAPCPQALGDPVEIAVGCSRVDRPRQELVGNRVVEGDKVEVPYPTHPALIVHADPPLKRPVGILPTAEEEDAVVLLEYVAEDHFELKRCAPALHSLRRKICERLQNDLVLDI